MFEFDEKIIELEGKLDDMQFSLQNAPKSPQLRLKAGSSQPSSSPLARQATTREPQTASPSVLRKPADTFENKVR